MQLSKKIVTHCMYHKLVDTIYKFDTNANFSKIFVVATPISLKFKSDISIRSQSGQFHF